MSRDTYKDTYHFNFNLLKFLAEKEKEVKRLRRKREGRHVARKKRKRIF